MFHPSRRPRTFLFTDIEGSTRLWDQHPEAMRAGLARHDALVRDLLAAHGGTVFKTVGDAVYAAFAEAPAAVAAALAVQRALVAADWGALGSLRVRIALHTGEAEARGDDYFGPTVNRATRLIGAGHGGQVLLSAATRAAMGGALPPSATLHDLGEHRLRDLVEPEHLFQLVVPDLPAEFPPLRSLEAFAHNLPVQKTRFIGREREIAEIRERLAPGAAGGRLLTLTGPGGTGKTRLSIQVAADLVDQYADGVWLVELAPLQDPALLASTVAGTLGVREEPGRPILTTLLNYLQARQLLLLLDNCEHLVEAAAQFAEAVLRTCRQVQILASSREALGIAGEAAYRVPSLSLPDLPGPGLHPVEALPAPDRLVQYEAVHLFLDRVTTIQPAFTLTAANAPAIAQICRRLDGIPLALELAAARVHVLPVEEIATRLDDRFRLLTGGSRTALPRQQTLRTSIDWSYDLLTDDERRLLRRLAVFAGGWTLEAAEQVAGEVGSSEFGASAALSPTSYLLPPDSFVLDALGGLVNKSLVIMEAESTPARYRMLETIRQYGREKLFESGEAGAVRDVHLAYFLGQAEQAAPHFRRADRSPWLAAMEAEHDNLRGALEWSLEQHPPAALRLAGALSWFWFFQDYWREGRQWLTDALAAAGPDAEPAARVAALNGAANLAGAQGQGAPARALAAESQELAARIGDQRGLAYATLAYGQNAWPDAEPQRTAYARSLELFRALGDPWGIAESLAYTGWQAMFERDFATAQACMDERLRVAQAEGDLWSIAWGLTNLASLAYHQGDYATARARFEEGMAVGRPVGTGQTRAGMASALAEVARLQGDYDYAVRLYNEVLVLRKEIGDWRAVGATLHNLAQIDLAQGRPAQAAALFAEALGLLQPLGGEFQRGGIECILGLGEVAEVQGQPERAARLFGAAWARLTAIQAILEPVDRIVYEQHLTAAQAQLPPDAWEAAWAAGAALPPDEAIRYALAGLAPPAAPGASGNGERVI